MVRENKATQSNKQFIVGNGILAFGVFFIVVLFLYLAFRTKHSAKTYPETFTITLNKSLAPDSISVLINDSLLFNQTMDETTVLRVKRFSESSLLMVVNNVTQDVSSFNLDPKKPKIEVIKQADKHYNLKH